MRGKISQSLSRVVQLFAIAVFLTGVAVADSERAALRTDFTGEWHPVFDRWEGLQELLKLQQANWIIRRSAGTVPVVERTVQTAELLEIEMVGPVPSFAMNWFVTRQVVVFDNIARPERSPLGVESMSRHYWEDAETLLHVHEVVRKDGLSYTAEQRRVLRLDGAEQHVITNVVTSDGRKLEALQVYTRGAE